MAKGNPLFLVAATPHGPFPSPKPGIKGVGGRVQGLGGRGRVRSKLPVAQFGFDEKNF